jgi:hypothetical protein
MTIHPLAETSPDPARRAVRAEPAHHHEVAAQDARTLPAGYGRGPHPRAT